MIESHSSLKVEGGKMVRLRLVHDGGRIVAARLTGDFMVHPEEALDEMERCLLGIDVRIDDARLTQVLGDAVTSSGAELIGFSIPHVVELVRRCLR